MKTKSTEESIVCQLEVLIGVDLPRVSLLDGAVNTVSGKERELSFDEFTTFPCHACFTDEAGNVIGLALSELQLTKLPEPILQLKKLKKLNLGNNRLKSLPREISKLAYLEELQLYGNYFSRIPIGIKNLSKLSMLNLAQNNLKEFPLSIIDLPHLRKVYLFNNKIKQLPEIIFKTSFEIIVDREGQDKPSESRGIYIEDNPIESPPIEIIRRGRETVQAYLESADEAMLPLNEVRLILVGDGGAGKTSLVKRLLNRKFDPNESQTHGINIDNWEITEGKTKIGINIWDFGGQEIMHATHQFFLSERSLYVLVLDGRKEEDPEYWLKHVSSFGGDSPVLVVLNKTDENPGFDVNRRFLQRKYEAIQSFHKVSCMSGDGVDSILKGVVQAIKKVEISKTVWPLSWFEIKKNLQSMGDHFITYNGFVALCEKQGVIDTGRQDALVNFLHDLGVVVHFSDFRLRDTHVLEPRWLTGAVYRIINAEILAKNHGVLSFAELSSILNSNTEGYIYPRDTHPYIVDIMKKFELCYAINDTTILIPDLLEVQEPAFEFDFNKSLSFRIDYDFLPHSILPRFIVRQHSNIHKSLCWRTGVVLNNTSLGTTAVVRVDQSAKKIYIEVAGKHKRDYLTIIRASFSEINQSFEKLEWGEKVLMPDDSTVAVSYDHLLRLEERGHSDYFPDGGSHAYKVQELLGTVRIDSGYSEEDLVRILKQVINQSDSEEKALAKANEVIMMQPNFMGMGINFNALVKKMFNKNKK